MKIKLSKSTAYGRVRYYPECPYSKIVTTIAGKATLDDEDLKLMLLNGCEAEFVERRHTNN